jgi:dynein intermediate chain 1, axonemal
VVVPANQAQLTEAELAQEIARTLTAANPHAPKNAVHFNLKERIFKWVLWLLFHPQRAL